jgi:hypothetical protein
MKPIVSNVQFTAFQKAAICPQCKVFMSSIRDSPVSFPPSIQDFLSIMQSQLALNQLQNDLPDHSRIIILYSVNLHSEISGIPSFPSGNLGPFGWKISPFAPLQMSFQMGEILIDDQIRSG